MELRRLQDLVDQSFAGICYRSIAAGTESTRAPPKSIFGAKPAQFDEWFFSDRWVPEVGLYNLTNFHLLADRFLVRDNKILMIPENGIHQDSIQNRTASGFGHGQQVLRIEEEVVLLCGPAYQMYGHWLVDFSPRLFCLVKTGYDLTKLRYLLPNDIRPFARQWLAALGITEDQIIFYDPIAQQCAIARAMIPTNLRGHGRASPLLAEAFQFFKATLQLGHAPSPTRKIFISRSGWKNLTRQLLNAPEIEAFFSKNGFEIIHPEKLSVRQQVEIFAQSHIIAGEYGTGLHNALFSSPGSKIIALRSNHAHPAFLQSGLCEVAGQDCNYVFGETSVIDDNHLFTINLGDIAECIDHAMA